MARQTERTQGIDAPSGTCGDLINIGPALCRQLAAIGVTTPEQLYCMGSEAAWLRIQQIDPYACLHRLYALEGAVRGIPKKDLPGEVKAACRAFVQAHRL